MPRVSAFHILRQVLDHRRPLDDVLAADDRFAALEPRDRALARNLVATSLRRKGQIDALIDHCLDRPPGPRAAPTLHILRLGICQLLFLETPAHAAVDTSVRLAERTRLGNYKALINGVLRRIGREGTELLAAQDAARLNTPDWLWRAWESAYGADLCRQIAEQHMIEAPLDVSVLSDPDGWAERLDAVRLPNDSLRLAGGGAIFDRPGFKEGGWWVQDAAAAMPTRFLAAQAGETVLDLCAAPGGKTAQLTVTGADVTAVDRADGRMKRLAGNMKRLSLNPQTVTADVAKWQPPAPADAILLDAPCTATGTIRRHPDIAWLKSPDDVASAAILQRQLLAAALPMLKPGGRLVYSVCSLQPEEGADVVDAVLAQTPGVARNPFAEEDCGGLGTHLTPVGDLRILPCQWSEFGGVDGFYIARLTRKG